MNAQQIAAAVQDDPALVAQYLPHILNGLEHFGINDHLTRVGCFATVAVECDWKWLTELGTGGEYNGRADLGNLQPGDGPRYKGRGFVQLTGRANYQSAGAALGLDLVGNPDLAADPHVAGLTLGLYFKTHDIQALCNARDWVAVRRAVNGGDNGLVRFEICVTNLLALPDGPPITTVGVVTILRTTPASDGKHAKDEKHRDVLLPIGRQVVFAPDPSPGPDHGKITEWLWAHVTIPGSQAHGWVERAHLQTTGG